MADLGDHGLEEAGLREHEAAEVQDDCPEVASALGDSCSLEMDPCFV